jgi:lipopolysaccharide export LptBFGC system permease protein LptF
MRNANAAPLRPGHARAIALIIPALAAAVFVMVLFFTLSQAQFLSLIGLITAYLLPPAGKETIIPIGIALGIPWWYMALAIVTVDAIAGLFMALNFALAYRIPYLGPLLLDLTKKTRQFLARHRWFASLWFFAIVLMVMVPVFGSGGIRGSVAGKILGLSTPLTLLAILTGSLIGCFGIALGSDVVLLWLCGNGALPAGIVRGVCGA